MRTPTLRLVGREELLGYIPYSLGFHPADSIVLLGLGKRRVELVARADADWPTREHVRQFTRALRPLRGVSRIFLVGYGPPVLDGPVRTVADALRGRGFLMAEALRVSDDRFHCLLCTECTGADGSQFEIGSSVAAAKATYAGVMVLPDRAALERSVQAIGGPAAVAMSQAVDRAEARLAALAAVAPAATSAEGVGWDGTGDGDTAAEAAGADEEGTGTAVEVAGAEGTGTAVEAAGAEGASAEDAGAAASAEGMTGRGSDAARVAALRVVEAGIDAVQAAMGKAKAGQRLDDDEIAWLTVLLYEPRVRDHAWAATDREQWQLDLWRDVTRRAEPIMAAPAATLLGWCAWRRGDGGLALIALSRAQRLDPQLRMAQLLLELLDRGSGPHSVKKWPLPLR